MQGEYRRRQQGAGNLQIAQQSQQQQGVRRVQGDVEQAIPGWVEAM